MITLVFATNNANKVLEIRNAVGNDFNIITLKEAGINIDIPEPYDTLAENATQKSRTIHNLINKNCFAEDTGLETDALNGAPGVKSARYAGEHGNSDANIEKLLSELNNKPNRTAKFRTVISLILDDKEYFFEGICEGKITTERSGEKGFGYDPVFIPNGANTTFASMDIEEKNKYSHRKKATQQLIDFLNQYDGKN